MPALEPDASPRYELWDLPESSEITYACRKWLRARKWGPPGEFLYERGEALIVIPTQKQHDKLCAWLGELAKHEQYLFDEICQKFDTGAFTGEYPWGRGTTAAYLNALTAALQKTNSPRDGHYWTARVRGAARKLGQLRESVNAKRRPRLDWTGKLPAGLNIRLAAGLSHGPRIGEEINGDGAWLTIPDFGALWMPARLPGPQRPSEAAYCELAHCDRRWRIRFVFATKNPKWNSKVGRNAAKEKT